MRSKDDTSDMLHHHALGVDPTRQATQGVDTAAFLVE